MPAKSHFCKSDLPHQLVPFPFINLSEKNDICFDEDDNHQILQTKTLIIAKIITCAASPKCRYLFFTKKMPVKQAVEQTHCVRHQLLSLTILWTPRAPCWATAAPGGRAQVSRLTGPKGTMTRICSKAQQRPPWDTAQAEARPSAQN